MQDHGDNRSSGQGIGEQELHDLGNKPLNKPLDPLPLDHSSFMPFLPPLAALIKPLSSLNQVLTVNA